MIRFALHTPHQARGMYQLSEQKVNLMMYKRCVKTLFIAYIEKSTFWCYNKDNKRGVKSVQY